MVVSMMLPNLVLVLPKMYKNANAVVSCLINSNNACGGGNVLFCLTATEFDHCQRFNSF